MKLRVASLLLSLFAMSNARSQCFEEKTDACDETLLEALFGDSNKEESCRKLEDAVKCIKEKAKECESEEDPDVQGALDNLDDILKNSCEVDNVEHDDNAQMTQCLKDNEDYLDECMAVGTAKTFEAALERENVDENFIMCSTFNDIAECIGQRLVEKCREEAQKLADGQFNDVPAEIVDACKAANIEKTSIALLEEFKKKK